jgi:Putative addiction module component
VTGESALSDEEIARVWAEEAERRDQEMDSGDDPGIPAEEVFRKLRARFQAPQGRRHKAWGFSPR